MACGGCGGFCGRQFWWIRLCWIRWLVERICRRADCPAALSGIVSGRRPRWNSLDLGDQENFGCGGYRWCELPFLVEADFDLVEVACFGAGPFLANFGYGGSGGGGLRGRSGAGGCVVALLGSGVVVTGEVYIVVGCF